MSDKKQEAPKLVEVELVKAHTHNGVPYESGAKIEVTDADRDWLEGAGVINAAPKEATKK